MTPAETALASATRSDARPVQRAEELACPECGTSFTTRIGNDTTAISCPSCGRSYPVRNGIPHFAVQLREQAETASSFGFAWKRFWSGSFDRESVFGLRMDETKRYFLDSFGVEESALRGARVLDAGTGSGRIPMCLRDAGCEVYAVDIHESLDVVKQAIGRESVRFYQADLLKLPFPDGFFDYVWSSGVIHHTPDTAQAFASLARKVKPGGRMFISVYGKMRHHYRMMRHLLPFAPKLPVPVTLLLAATLALPLYAGFNGVLLGVRATVARRGPGPYRVLGFEIENVEPKSYRSILLNIFDQLHPKFQHEHSAEEVASWFERNGFRDIVPTNTVGMIEMRGTRR